VERAIERTGYADFWELQERGVLPRETLNYVPQILALAIIAKYPEEYGLDEVQPAPAVAYDKVEIAATTSLQLVADLIGTPLAQIEELNPSLLRAHAPAGHALRVPKGTATGLIAALELIPGEKRSAWRAHRVGEGETIAQIASLYRATPAQIAGVNEIDSGDLEPGDLLVIPVTAAAKAAGRAPQARRAAPSTKSRQTRPATPKGRS
jgi:membrane-bound lytic murein transglycosylase D